MEINAPDTIKNFLKHRVEKVSSSIKNARFNVIEKNPRRIQFNDDFSSCVLSAADINNLDNIYNKIGLLQAFYRFIGFHALSKRVFLLHGSSVIYGGKVILFGDNGESVGKTFSSLELGLKSGQYLADEFVFWDENSGKIFSDYDIPIHVRKKVQKHFQDEHNLRVDHEFLLPQYFDFRSCKQKKLDMVCYVNFTNAKEKVLILPKKLAFKYALKTFAAHFEKMFNPKLDHFQFINQSDEYLADNQMRARVINSNAFRAIFPRLKDAARNFIECVESVELFVKRPCDIPNLIDTIL